MLPHRLPRPTRVSNRTVVTAATAAVVLLVGATAWLHAQTRDRDVHQPFLWRAERPGTPPVWLFGTIHVPDSRVQRLAPAVQRAFADATHVVTEIPLDLEAQLSVSQRLLLPADTHLQAVLGKDRFARLVAVVQTALGDEAPALTALVVPALDRLRPWAAMAQLSLLEYLPDVLEGRPSLDARLFDDARRAGKRVSALETVVEQAAVFDAFTIDEQIALLDAALTQAEAGHDSGQSPARLLVDQYLRGDAEALVATMDDQAPTDAALAARFERVLLRDRNHRMIERFERLRAAHPDDVFFVAVGALHLVGPGSLPTLLEQRGYRVERISSLHP